METPEQRSRTMRAVKGTDTSIELEVRSLLHKAGFRYRLHARDLPGKPDVVFPSRRAVLFIHGCFWHGHSCKRGARQPKTNADYWLAKIGRNRERDARIKKALTAAGWRVYTIWECELNDDKAMARLKKALSRRAGRKG
jgi:DNA mismatch endonuclease (patch repair protein)